jgi:hypothetical protein
MIGTDKSINELCAVASSNIVTQVSHWTTTIEFKADKMLINEKLPFVPLVIPQYNRLDN